ncbi:hypothetical protein F442_06979 [Phytophthora nicotianae P10297]|uniref:CCHC-type domain-containing protein n=1 Tax=Phytophthora nicotianae P10297 TaxID=1317064 RepID=W2ZIJ8_PHYNI|nr:hypothetical protein F442_06979 [Phytophthora nicotianae P10297]
MSPVAPPFTPGRGIRQGADMYTQDGHIVCGRCHTLGHARMECEEPYKQPNRPQGQSQQRTSPYNNRNSQQRSGRACFICNQKDHLVAECPAALNSRGESTVAYEVDLVSNGMNQPTRDATEVKVNEVYVTEEMDQEGQFDEELSSESTERMQKELIQDVYKEEGSSRGSPPQKEDGQSGREKPRGPRKPYYARLFTTEELDDLEAGRATGVSEEKEEYDKELEDRLIGLDEVALKERVKKNAEGQKAVSLGELSKILDIPEEVLARTREAAPGELSSPEYWLEWYRRTLATTAAAKRANRDFRSTPIGKTVLEGEQEYDIPAQTDAEDDADKRKLEEPGGVFLVRALPPPGKPKPPDGSVDIDEFVVRENVGVELSEHPPVVGAVSPPSGSPVDRGKLPAEWRGLVRRVVYLLVRLEEIQNGSLCLLCQTAKPPIEVLSDGETVPRREQDLRTRAGRVVDHFVDPKESALR